MSAVPIEKKLGFAPVEDFLFMQHLKRSHEIMTQISCGTYVSVLDTGLTAAADLRMGQKQ